MRGVAFYGQILDLTDSWLTFKFWKTPVHVLGLPQPGVPQVHSQNIWDERIPMVFSFKWNLFGTTAINTNFSAPTQSGSWTLHQSFSVWSSQWYPRYQQSKLFEIGYISSDLCSFCTWASESLYNLFYFSPFSKTFWSDFESFWHLLTNEKIQLSLQDIIVGVVTTKCPSHQST